MRTRTISILILVCIAAVGGCGRNLMPTPNLYHDASVDPFRDVPPSRQSNVVEILYATDRDPLEPRTVNEMYVRYGTDRSNSVAFGNASVQIGRDDLTWEELASASRAKRRSAQLALRYVGAEEVVRLPAWPRAWSAARSRSVRRLADPRRLSVGGRRRGCRGLSGSMGVTGTRPLGFCPSFNPGSPMK